MNKIVNMLFILGLFYSSANALELGQIKMQSHLNEPLRASFTLGHIDADSLADIILSLASQQAYKSIGLTKPHFLSNLKFKITAGPNSQHIVNISTRQRIREPILDILVKVTEKQSSISRLYTLILDPREYIDRKSPQAISTVIKPVQKTSGKAKQNQQVKPSTNRLPVKNNSISIIAQNSPLHEKYSVYQIMRAFYLINSKAFNRGNINKLMSGSSLIVPDESSVAEVSRQQSINFVYAASKDNPFNKNSTTQQKASVKTSPKQSQPVSTKSPGNTVAVTTNVEPAARIDSQNKYEQQLLRQRMLDDVNTWRTVSEEFKSLSSVVQSQINAMKLQSDVLQTINTQLEEKNKQIELVNIRLDVLESSRLSAAMKPEDGVSGESEVIDTQRESIKDINQNLSKKLDEIVSIKLRLEALEQLDVKTVTEVKPGSLEPVLPAADNQLNLTIKPDRLNTTLLGLSILLAAVLLIILMREIIWRRRVKYLSSSNAILPTDKRPESEQEADDKHQVDDAQKPIIDEKLEQAKDSVEEVKAVTNLKIAEQKFEDAVTSARDFKPPFTPGMHTQTDEEINLEALYAEIDVLIAYQLYEEALDLLSNSRKVFEGNGCLDIRELEILAYTKNVDLFFQKYERQKHTLSAEYPEEWERIAELNEQLSSEFQVDSNIVTIKAMRNS